jgi:hypothetical protein
MSDMPIPPLPPSSSSPGTNPTPVTHATNMARNIAVSVISTVLGATLIYYLGFKNDGGGDNTLLTKEATTKAWRSYVTIENIYYKHSVSILNDLQQSKKFGDFKENIIRESDKFQRDLPEVIKAKNIDNTFVSMIQRRLENEKSTEVRIKDYLDNIQAILDKNLPANERQEKLEAEDKNWMAYSKGNRDRAVTDIEDLAKTLSDRYQTPFAMTDLLVYNEIKKEESGNTNPTDNNANKPTKNGPADPNANTNDDNGKNAANTDDNNRNNPNDTKNNPGDAKVSVSRNDDQNNKNIIVDEKLLEGQWDTKDAGIDLYKNGVMYWSTDNGDRASGTWKFSNNQLYMYPKASNKVAANTTWIFNLSNVTPNSFTMTLAYKPFNTYYLIRSTEN